jgi:hypothetical protein
LNGVDESTQSAKETQDIIDEKLGATSQIVARTMFQSQHSLNDLLEASDIKFKEELSLIVPTQVWQNALSLSRKKAKDAATLVSRYDGMITLRSEDLKELQVSLTDTQLSCDELEMVYRDVVLDANMPQCDHASDSSDNRNNIDYDIVENEIQLLQSTIQELEMRRQKVVNEQRTAIDNQNNIITNISLGQDTMKLENLRINRNQIQTKYAIGKERIAALENQWQVNLSNGFDSSSFTIPLDCPTCGQRINNVSRTPTDSHSHDELTEKAKLECENAVATLSNILNELANVEGELLNAEASESEILRNLESAKQLLDTIANEWNDKVSIIDVELASARLTYRISSDKLALAMKQMQANTKQMERKVLFKSQLDAVNAARESVQRLSSEIETCQSRIKEIQSKQNESTMTSKLMSELSEAFGSKGIQSFVLQNAVNVLERVTNKYLLQLSDGKQRLKLSLDSGDKIVRRAFVYNGHDDQQMKERALASLSGGQWKRCSLALSLGFTDILAKRGKFRSSLLVLDEPLTHLDQSGRSHVGSVLRTLLQQQRNVQQSTSTNEKRQRGNAAIDAVFGLQVSTILVILQDLAAEEMEESFDCIDEVVKTNGQSRVRIDELTTGSDYW